MAGAAPEGGWGTYMQVGTPFGDVALAGASGFRGNRHEQFPEFCPTYAILLRDSLLPIFLQ
eukprot:4544123-Pyramimonas_sp.AAC.1